MRLLPTVMLNALASNDFVGDRRAVTRVTIQKFSLGVYNITSKRIYSTMLMSKSTTGAAELPNLKSVKWSRAVADQIASCTIELSNARPADLPIDQQDALDQLGYFTYNRGKAPYAYPRWHHSVNPWRDVIVPDRMVKVYQGYGVDYSVPPEDDPHLVQTGAFLIDDVTYSADGGITIEGRDLGRMLVDEIAFPPVVPFPVYPLTFTAKKTTSTKHSSVNATWRRPTYDTDSNVPYVGSNGAVFGHHGSDAFDSSNSSYWLSIGNSRPDRGYSYEFVQGRMKASTVKAMRAYVFGGPYKVYVSVYANGRWQGKATIPYDPNNPASAPNGANIKFVASGTVAANSWSTFTFKTAYTNVTKIRFTFTDLWNSGLGTYKYRAAVRTMQFASSYSTSTTTTSTTTGDYGDYSELVKLFLAMGGFYWPQDGVIKGTGTNAETYHFSANDPYLIRGRVWGDILMSGVAGVAGTTLTADVWDKKPLLDCINYVRDILGFVFYVDELGAAKFRLPNLYKLGNYRVDSDGLNSTYVTGPGSCYEITEDNAILGLRAKLSSRNLRERVFIGNTNGKIGAVSDGRFPYKVGFRRVGGWTDQNFASDAEAQLMADLITLRQLFTYRQNSIRIPGHPGIQCDDQVKIVERVTGERYFHYVNAITSQWDSQSGQWFYDLDTSWLGADPTAEWAFKTTGLSAVTQAYLHTLAGT